VNVYVLDTGIQIHHEDFEGRARHGAVVIADETIDDENGHGTSVASIIGGKRYGIAKKVNLISVKLLNENGAGTTADIIKALSWVSKEQKRYPGVPALVNMSLSVIHSVSVNKLVERLTKENITIVAAAGNGEMDGRPANACRVSPASAASCITVAASDAADQAVSYSNFGRCVTLFAPGINIPTARYEGNNTYWFQSGTSMSAPFVTGVAALILSEYGPMSSQTLHNMIIDTATKGVIRGIVDGETPNRLLYSEMAQASSYNGATLRTHSYLWWLAVWTAWLPIFWQ
jgi:subtilisin family serine protease